MTRSYPNGLTRLTTPRFTLSDITPLTYRDGESYASLLWRLFRHVTEVLNPSLETSFRELITQLEAEMAKAEQHYIDGVEEFQRIHDAFMSDVNGALTALNDTSVSDLVDDNTSLFGSIVRDLFASRTRVNERSVVPQDYGAIADWNGTVGTDNTEAFQAAIDATEEGGTVYVPPGRYFFRGTLYITKSMALTSGGSGNLVAGNHGTQLIFDAGVSGIVVQENTTGNGPRPSHYQLNNLYIRGAGHRAGDSVGVYINASKGYLENLSIENFGSHGLHIQGGREQGGGNANLQYLAQIRSYSNGGDGIRLEGTDSNACLLLSPDVIANVGYGINLERSSMNVIISPHAYQSGDHSAGAYRDNGNSNYWLQVYSEHAAPFHIGAGASSGHMQSGAYGRPAITYDSNGAFYTYKISTGAANTENYVKLVHHDGEHRWDLFPNIVNGSLLLKNNVENQNIWNIPTESDRVLHYVDQLPSSSARGKNLGSFNNRWDSAHAETVRAYDTLRVGDLHVRANGASLEISTNGTTWRRIVTE